MQFLVRLGVIVMLHIHRFFKLNGLLCIFVSFIFIAQVAPRNRDDQAHGTANLESSEGVLEHYNNSCAPDCSQRKEDRSKG